MSALPSPLKSPTTSRTGFSLLLLSVITLVSPEIEVFCRLAVLVCVVFMAPVSIQLLGVLQVAHGAPTVKVSAPLDRPTNHLPLKPKAATSALPSPLKSPTTVFAQTLAFPVPKLAQRAPTLKSFVPFEVPTNQLPLKPKPAMSSLPSPLKSATNNLIQTLLLPVPKLAQAAPGVKASAPLER